MLWYKGWLETRFKVVFLLSFAVFPLVLTLAVGHHPTTRGQHAPTAAELAEAENGFGYFGMYYSIIPLFLAGSGIKTEYGSRKRGVRGSTYFTLSLPVSRFRLFATRAGLGMLETVGILAIAPYAIWAAIVEPGDPPVSLSNLFFLWVSLSAGTSVFYFVGTLLSTFMDEVYRNWVSLFGVALLLALLSKVPLLAPLNVFRAMGLPLFPPHSIPWASMGISLGVAAVLGFAALRVVQTREY